MKYDVHIYVTVRVKVSSIEAESHKEAMEKATAIAEPELYPMFDHCIGDNISDVEYGEEISGYLVDEANDTEYSKTRFYDAEMKEEHL